MCFTRFLFVLLPCRSCLVDEIAFVFLAPLNEAYFSTRQHTEELFVPQDVMKKNLNSSGADFGSWLMIFETMSVEEYKKLWQEAIHLCELETNAQEASEFVHQYYNTGDVLFQKMDDKTLFITFIGLVVYERKFNLRYGSTTPAKFCYREILERTNRSIYDKEFIYDVGDWAADYSINPYIPMDTYRGLGPRAYFEFRHQFMIRTDTEKMIKKLRLEKKRLADEAKVEAAKEAHDKRTETIEQMKENSVNDNIGIIESSNRPVFYYIELIDYWIYNRLLNSAQKDRLLDLFPKKSTKHNNKIRKKLEDYRPCDGQ